MQQPIVAGSVQLSVSHWAHAGTLLRNSWQTIPPVPAAPVPAPPVPAPPVPAPPVPAPPVPAPPVPTAPPAPPPLTQVTTIDWLSPQTPSDTATARVVLPADVQVKVLVAVFAG